MKLNGRWNITRNSAMLTNFSGVARNITIACEKSCSRSTSNASIIMTNSGMLVPIEPRLCVELLMALLILSKQLLGSLVWTGLRAGRTRRISAVGRLPLQTLV